MAGLLTPEEREGKGYQEQVDDLNEKIYDTLVDKHLEKGEMFSYFQFGGSDIIVLLQESAFPQVYTGGQYRHYGTAIASCDLT